jgi:hypothetical protein
MPGSRAGQRATISKATQARNQTSIRSVRHRLMQRFDGLRIHLHTPSLRHPTQRFGIQPPPGSCTCHCAFALPFFLHSKQMQTEYKSRRVKAFVLLQCMHSRLHLSYGADSAGGGPFRYRTTINSDQTKGNAVRTPVWDICGQTPGRATQSEDRSTIFRFQRFVSSTYLG